VLDIGCGPTPMTYVSVKHLQADAGIMITGSHNPPTHNGFKIVLGSKPFYGDDVMEIGRVCQQGEFIEGQGGVQVKDVTNAYLEGLRSAFEPDTSSLKIVWDAGNGAAGQMMAEITKLLPGDHILLNETIDGTFPVHPPDPTVEKNLVQLKEEIIKQRADLGFAFDGDADRVVAMDNQGRMFAGDQLVAILALGVLQQEPGATIIVDVKTSQVIIDFLASKGANVVMWKTGHSLIKAKMLEIDASLAGEMSGHIFYKDYGRFDDGLYAAIKLFNFLASSEKSLSDYLDELPTSISTPEMRIDVSEEQKFGLVESIKESLDEENVSYSDIDGVRVQLNDGWWLLRASNTQAALILRCEANNEQSFDVVTSHCKAFLERVDGIPNVSL